MFLKRQSKNKIDVFHIIDSPKRDLEWRMMLAYKLSKYGINSYISSFQNVRSKILSNGGGIICGRLGGTSGRSKIDNKFLDELSNYPHAIFYFHDEGGLLNLKDYEESKIILSFNILEREVFQRIYFWGEAQKEVFLKEKWINKTAIIGSPRLDIYDKYLANDNSRGSKYILITTRFSSVNTVPDDPISLSKRMLEIRIEGGEAENKDINQIIKSMFEKWSTASHDFVSYILMVSKLCTHFPNINFVLRPHPAENVEWYKSHLINLKI